VGVIFLIGLTFFVLVSYSAAFIPSSPFHSPFSHFIAYLSKKVLPEDPKDRKRRLIYIGISSTIMAVMTIILVVYEGTTYQLLIFFPVAGVFAIARDPDESDEYSPLYGPPELVVLGGFTIFITIAVALYVNTTRDPGRTVYIVASSVGFGLLALFGYSVDRLTREVPKTLEAEAFAWLLESSSEKFGPSVFEKARHIANTPQRKALLLNTLLPLLPNLIASRVRHQPGETENGDLQKLLSCLEDLLKFHGSEQSFWRNKAAVKRPTLLDKLDKQLREQFRGQLLELRRNADPRLRDSAEAVWRHYGIDFEGEKTADRA
jgi:hypothetical protein